MIVKRVLALLLCGVLLTSAAACGDGSGEGGGPASTSAGDVDGGGGGGSAETETAQGEGWFAGRDFSEKVVINLASVQIEDKDYNYGDDWVTWWSETFNIEWDITSLTWENWSERLRIWINSDDMPDMAVWDYKHGEAVNYVEQELLKKLPDGWKSSYPNLAKAQADSPMSEKAEETFGGTYVLFRPIYSNNRPTEKLTAHISAYLRKDWAAAAGVELQEAMTLSEVYEYARKVKEADPGSVGPTFSPIVARPGNLGWFVHWNTGHSGVDGSPYFLDSDGEYKWGPAQESTLEALQLLSSAYEEGLVAPEFYTIQDPDDFGMFYTAGRSAVMVGDGMAWRMTEFDQNLSSALNLNYGEAVEVVTVLGEDGYYHGQPLTNFWGANIFSPHIDDVKMERILQLLDFSCTEEGQLMIRCGIEGVDWEMGADGEINSFLDIEDSLWDKYAMMPIYVNMMVLSDDFQFRDPNYKEEYREKTRRMHVLRQEHSTEQTFPTEPDWTIQLHDSQALNLATMTYADEYAALIVKDGDIEANWQAWVNEKMPMIQPVLDELNAAR